MAKLRATDLTPEILAKFGYRFDEERQQFYSIKNEMWLKNTIDKDGYVQNGLWFDGVYCLVRHHRYIATQYHGKPPAGKDQVNHINGIKTDNSPENLEWCSAKENINHAHATGLRKGRKGTKHHNAILNDADVKLIRERLSSGEKQNKIADEFSISKALVCLIANSKVWQHLPTLAADSCFKTVGERHPRALLTESCVHRIRKLISEGLTNVAIAKEFGVHANTVSGIKHGRNWSHVPVATA